jgi:Protein of unknown function (DUF433)
MVNRVFGIPGIYIPCRRDAIEDVLAEFPALERDDVLACIAYATASMKFKDIEVPAA